MAKNHVSGRGCHRSPSLILVSLLQGISEFSSHMQPGFLRRNGELVMTYQNPFFSAVSPTDAINMHLGKSFGAGLFLEGGYRFHLSWCRSRRLPSNRSRSRQGPEELKVGRLYGSADQYLCQEAYTVSSFLKLYAIAKLATDPCNYRSSKL
jgi:hypothetical protein